MLLVVVVDAETPEELVEAFAAQALRLLRAAAAKAIRAKNLMVFILFLLVHLQSRLVAVEQTLAGRRIFATRIGNNFRYRRFRPQVSLMWTPVPGITWPNSSMMSALRIRTQPWLAGSPICASWLVPWM